MGRGDSRRPVGQGHAAGPHAGREDTGVGTLSWSRTSDLRRMKTLLSLVSYQGMWRSRQDLNLQLDFSEHSLSERADYQLSHYSVSQSPRTGPRILSTKKGRKISPNLDWSWWTDLNPRPTDYKSAALPTELHQHICGRGRFSLPLWENRRFVARTVPSAYRACQRWKTGNGRRKERRMSVRNSYQPDGGDSRVRTGDPLLAKQMRSQLRYTPK